MLEVIVHDDRSRGEYLRVRWRSDLYTPCRRALEIVLSELALYMRMDQGLFPGGKKVLLMNEGIGNKTLSRKDHQSRSRTYQTSKVKGFGACIVLFVTL